MGKRAREREGERERERKRENIRLFVERDKVNVWRGKRER